nr:MAG: hypothetical protein [Marsupenaeus japonicus pemonivirus]
MTEDESLQLIIFLHNRLGRGLDQHEFSDKMTDGSLPALESLDALDNNHNHNDTDSSTEHQERTTLKFYSSVTEGEEEEEEEDDDEELVSSVAMDAADIDNYITIIDSGSNPTSIDDDNDDDDDLARTSLETINTKANDDQVFIIESTSLTNRGNILDDDECDSRYPDYIEKYCLRPCHVEDKEYVFRDSISSDLISDTVMPAATIALTPWVREGPDDVQVEQVRSESITSNLAFEVMAALANTLDPRPTVGSEDGVTQVYGLSTDMADLQSAVEHPIRVSLCREDDYTGTDIGEIDLTYDTIDPCTVDMLRSEDLDISDSVYDECNGGPHETRSIPGTTKCFNVMVRILNFTFASIAKFINKLTPPDVLRIATMLTNVFTSSNRG